MDAHLYRRHLTARITRLCWAGVSTLRLRFGLLTLAGALSMGLGCSPRAGTVTPKLGVSPSVGQPSSGRNVTFIEDDVQEAFAIARRSNRHVFVDVWAPWCHSCLSMRSFVLNDPRLAELSPHYVFAAVNSEHEINAEFVRRHPISAWPTFLVFAPGAPADAQPKLIWAGTTTAPELVELLRAAVAAQGQEVDSVHVASTLVARGNHAAAIAVASVEFARLTEAARTGSVEVRGRRARIMELLAGAYQGAGRREDLLRFAASVCDEPPSTSLATVLVLALGVSSKVMGLTEEARRVRAAAIALAQNDALLVDDRSSLYEALLEAGSAGATGEAETRALATRWVALLEQAADAASTPPTRAVFDAHRVLAYLALGQPARALPMLERSERDLPDDYNPPARLARVLLEMGKLEEADAAVTRALAKVSGPRELRIAGLAADIAIRRGAPLRAVAVLERAVQRAKQGALPGSYAQALVDTETRLRGLRDSISGGP